MKLCINKKWMYTNLVVVALLYIAGQCAYIEGDVAHESVYVAGEEATFKMSGAWDVQEDRQNVRLILGYLVPKSWKAGETTKVTYVSNIDEGEMTMSLIPSDVLPKNGNGLTWPAALRAEFGFGPNVLDDMEWLVYQSDKVYSAINGEDLKFTATFKTVTGLQNMRVRLGFFLNHDDDGLGGSDHYTTYFTDCIEIIEGKGAVIDFCELQLYSVQPLTATPDDIITFSFQGDIEANELQGESAIYFNATAFTDKGNVYAIAASGEKNKMMKESTFGNSWSITFWPAGYFNVPDDEEITQIEYFFQNEDGSKKVMRVLEDASEVPFLYSFGCL